MGNIDSITLGDVAERTAVLNVACSRCERAGRYSLETLVTRHGRWFGIPSLLALLSAIARNAKRAPLPFTICAGFIARIWPNCSCRQRRRNRRRIEPVAGGQPRCRSTWIAARTSGSACQRVGPGLTDYSAQYAPRPTRIPFCPEPEPGSSAVSTGSKPGLGARRWLRRSLSVWCFPTQTVRSRASLIPF
jgi:hypothetical protein